jgi:hypothetical protein
MAWQSPALNYELDDAAIAAFIARHDGAFAGQLSGFLNYSRVVSLAHFEGLVERHGLQAQAHTGIVSGSAQEPELRFLQSGKVSVSNLEGDQSFDLDKSWLGLPSPNYSMTICNQVLEHVFNPHVAFANLVHQTAAGGAIYVSIPTINCIHGEPYFYSSGFHPRFLERLGQEHGLEILNIGYWGSHKYMINAVCGIWLAANQLAPTGTQGVRGLQRVEGRVKQEPYITDCWGLFRKV